MKLYIANQTSSQTVQIVANELGLSPELIHFDVTGRTTSNGDDFSVVNPLGYVPVLALDKELITEATVIVSYLADQHPEAGLAPTPGTLERVKLDQLLAFIATEIAQKHIPLMRKLMTEDGAAWTRNKLVMAYTALDKMLADGRPFLTGDRFTVADAYAWGTWWSPRSGAEIGHLKHLAAWKARMDARPSVLKALQDEAALFASHTQRLAA